MQQDDVSAASVGSTSVSRVLEVCLKPCSEVPCAVGHVLPLARGVTGSVGPLNDLRAGSDPLPPAPSPPLPSPPHGEWAGHPQVTKRIRTCADESWTRR